MPHVLRMTAFQFRDPVALFILTKRDDAAKWRHETSAQWLPGAELLTHAVDEQLHPPAARAHVDVEVLAVLEQLTDLAEYAPPRALVKFLRALVFQCRPAPGATHRICISHVSLL